MGVFQEGKDKKNILKHVPSGLVGTRFYPSPSPSPHGCLPCASIPKHGMLLSSVWHMIHTQKIVANKCITLPFG